ncbi:MAG: DivIVA domain-containing protein [Myxococcota bacterium]|nr:DivIVA domain-containing protein [Myxococcota bacterium]
MRITPLDLQNHHFRRRLAGYAPDEVDEFLRLVADDYAAALREIEAQRAEIAKLGQRVEDLVANEDVLQETLTTAQKLAEELKRTAMKEAEVMVSEAEVKSEKVLEAAHRRAAKLAQDISEMKNLKLRLAASVRAVIETHLELVDGLAKDRPEDPELEGMVAYLTGAPREPRGSREP